MVAMLVDYVAQLSTIQPVWTFEAAFGTEQVVYVDFLSEEKVVYVTNHGMVGWLDARGGKLAKFTRVGQQVVSGTMYAGKMWLLGPRNTLVQIDPHDGRFLGTHELGKDIDAHASDGSPFVLVSRFDRPIDVLTLPDLSSNFVIPKARGNWTGSATLTLVAVVIDQNLLLWDASSKRELFTRRLPLGDVLSVCFSPDAKHLGITFRAWAGTILYEPRTMKRLFGVKGTFPVPEFANSHNLVLCAGHYLNEEPTLRIPGTEREWVLLPATERAVDASFSPLDRLVVLARKGKVSLYRVPTGIPKR